MMTVHEVSSLSGVSIRALHHYDRIGLLPATEVTEAGYRLYDHKALERLQMILLFKELQFSLKEITVILDDPKFDRERALEQQIHLLELRREHLGDLIDLAKEIRTTGVMNMSKKSFAAFDTSRMDEFAARAKESWGNTDAYQEYEKKADGRTREEEISLGSGLMDIFAEFGKVRNEGPESAEAQVLVKKLQGYITEHYYNCTDEILESLGQMYAAGGEFTENIDACAGEGTAVFTNEAITAYLLAE